MGSTTTYYVGDYYEIQGSTVRKYYYVGGQRVAMSENGTVYWLLSDHLGSTAITTNSGGGKTGELRYYPFGSERYNWGNTPTTYRFTGQRSEEAGIGLYFYHARWYDPALGRFVQADTIVPEPGNPIALDRYVYAANNPIKYIDPSGHCWGFASFIRGLPGYGTTCNNLDMARTIVKHSETSLKQKVGAVLYIGAEAITHGTLAVGVAGLACSAVAPCATAAESALGIGTAACADGNCTNEAQAVGRAIQNGANAVKTGTGIRYNSFEAFKSSQGSAGAGMAWHHIVEQNSANIGNFGKQLINNTSNMIRLPSGAGLLHQRISGYYSSIQPLVTGSDTLTIRQWIQTKSFEFQWNFGVELIKRFGGAQTLIDKIGAKAK